MVLAANRRVQYPSIRALREYILELRFNNIDRALPFARISMLSLVRNSEVVICSTTIFFYVVICSNIISSILYKMKVYQSLL